MACFSKAEKGKIPRTETPRLELTYAKAAEDLSSDIRDSLCLARAFV
jgi:hypothetical protein